MGDNSKIVRSYSTRIADIIRNYLSVTSRTPAFIFIGRNHSGVRDDLRTFGFGDDFVTDFAINVSVRSDARNQRIDRSSTSATIETFLVIHVVLHRDFLRLVNSPSASKIEGRKIIIYLFTLHHFNHFNQLLPRTSFSVLRLNQSRIRVDFRTFRGNDFQMTGFTIKSTVVTSNAVRIQFSIASRTFETFLMKSMPAFSNYKNSVIKKFGKLG